MGAATIVIIFSQMSSQTEIKQEKSNSKGIQLMKTKVLLRQMVEISIKKMQMIEKCLIIKCIM